MKTSVTTQLNVDITLHISELEALALSKLTGYNNEDFMNHLAKFVHGFDPNTPERKGMLSLLETLKPLHNALTQIAKVRKENKTLDVR